MAREVLEIRTKDSILRSHGSSHSYHYAEFLKVLVTVPPAHSQPLIRALVEVLGRAISLDLDGKTEDRSYSWRPAIEDSDQNWCIGDIRDSLVTTLRDLIDRFIVQLEPRSSMCSALDELLTHEPAYAIFKRLKLYFLATYPEHAGEAIVKALFRDIENFWLWHEYAVLLRAAFPLLAEPLRKAYLSLIDVGPRQERPEDYCQYWRRERLDVIKNHLSPEEVDRYASLFAAFPAPDHPEFISHVGSWKMIGPTSPTDQRTLAALPTEALLKYLVDWKPTTGSDSSEEGLARELSTVIKDDAGRFSRDARFFADTRLNIVYLYYYFFGMLAASREGRQLDWAPIVDLAECVAERWPIEQERAQSADGMVRPAPWVGIFQQLAYVLENGLNRTDGGIPFTERWRVWKVIERCCECADPSLTEEEQFGENGLGPAHVSINSARGVGFLALFAYIFWWDRHRDPDTDKSVSRVPPEAKTVLKRHLDPNHDASLSVRFICGQFSPWLYLYDRVWAREVIDDLFPRAHMNRRYAAWEGYLSRQLFEEVFDALRDVYELAIDDLNPSIPDRRYWFDPIVGLGQHLVIAYAFGTDSSGYLCRRFFREADAKQRGDVVSFGGRVYVHRNRQPGELTPDDDRLRSFWEWRLAESDDTEELANFGWWVRPGRFDDQWQLQMLEGTLKKTKGVIQPDFEVLKALSVMATARPLEVARVLDLLVGSAGAQRRLLWNTSEIQDVLSKVRETNDPNIIRQTDAIADYLTKLGFESYRNLHSRGSSAGVNHGKDPARVEEFRSPCGSRPA